MNNSAFEAGSLSGPGFMAYAILLVLITLAAGVMIGLTVAALAMAHSILCPLRLFLINLLLAGLFMAVAVVTITSTSAILVPLDPQQPRPPLYLCRVFLWMYAVGAVARVWDLAAFSLTVLAVVRFGKKTISLRYAVVFIAILWIAPSAISLYILLPYVFGAQFVQNVACFPDDNTTIIEAQYTLKANWCISGGIIPLIVSITVPNFCLCYIKRNVANDEVRYRKGIAKFCLFLVAGGILSIMGQLLPGLLSYFYVEAPGVYISYGVAAVSLFPTPTIIIIYFKPVQKQVKKIVAFSRLTKRAGEPKGALSINGTVETEEKI